MPGVADLVEEVNPAFAATMGGIPGGTAGSPADPSMAHAVELAVADAQAITLAHLVSGPTSVSDRAATAPARVVKAADVWRIASTWQHQISATRARALRSVAALMTFWHPSIIAVLQGITQ